MDSNRGYASVLAQLDGSSGALQATYTLGNGTDRVTQATSGGFRFYLQDAHGNVRGLVDGNASPTQTYAYDAFGNALVTQVNANEAANDFRYTGEQLDGETGTYYLRARNYDPAVGRFTQWDDYDGDDSVPISLNHYAYASSAPTYGLDPAGHNTIEEEAAVAENQAIASTATDAALKDFIQSFLFGKGEQDSYGLIGDYIIQERKGDGFIFGSDKIYGAAWMAH